MYVLVGLIPTSSFSPHAATAGARGTTESDCRISVRVRSIARSLARLHKIFGKKQAAQKLVIRFEIEKKRHSWRRYRRCMRADSNHCLSFLAFRMTVRERNTSRRMRCDDEISLLSRWMRLTKLTPHPFLPHQVITTRHHHSFPGTLPLGSSNDVPNHRSAP